MIPKQAQGLGRPRKPCGTAATAARRPNSYLPSAGITHHDSKGSLRPRNRLDHHAVLKFPWTAKKTKNNTLVFTVDAEAKKPETSTLQKLHDIDGTEVSALIWAGGSPDGTLCNDP